MDFLRAVDVAAAIGGQIKRSGLSWELLAPAAAEGPLRELRGQGADQNVWLDPSFVPLTSDNYFLLCFRSQGVPVAKMGARIDMVTEGFNNFSSRMLRTIYRADNGEMSDHRFPGETEGLNGRIVYIGDLAVTRRIVCKPSLAQLIMALMFVAIDQKWGKPDHVICWTRPTQRVAQSLGPSWRWIDGTGSFSQPASSDFRGYRLGILSANRFDDQLAHSAALSVETRKESQSLNHLEIGNAPIGNYA